MLAATARTPCIGATHRCPTPPPATNDRAAGPATLHETRLLPEAVDSTPIPFWRYLERQNLQDPGAPQPVRGGAIHHADAARTGDHVVRGMMDRAYGAAKIGDVPRSENPPTIPSRSVPPIIAQKIAPVGSLLDVVM